MICSSYSNFFNKLFIYFFCLCTAAPSAPAVTATTATTGPPTPQFSYHDINVYALAGLAPHITINSNVSSFYSILIISMFRFRS